MANNSTVHRLGDVCGAGFYSGDSFPQPATPHRYFSRREHANAPPRSMVVEAAPPSGLPPSSCSPQWDAPASHAGVQADRYGVPQNVWPDAQHNDPFLLAMNASAPYINQSQEMGTINANGSTAYQQDDRIPVGRGPHGLLPVTDFQPECTGTVPAREMDSGQSAPVGADARPFVCTAGAETPVISESLRFFARRYVLDPGSRIDAIHLGTGAGYGRLKIVIVLEVMDSGA